MTQSCCVTSALVQSFCFKWIVKDYSVIKDCTEKLVSGTFTTDGPVATKWELWLYPYGHGNGASDHLSLYVNFIPNTPNDSRVMLQSTYMIQSGFNEYFSLEGRRWEYSLEKGTNAYGFTKFISNEALQERSDDLIPDDTLTILVKGKLLLDITHDMEGESIEVPMPALISDFVGMLKSGFNSDVTLVAKDGTRFPAHRNVICARSPVFAAMFRHKTVETDTGTVPISDVDPHVLEALLHFVYTDQSPPNFHEMTKDLMVAADKYELPRLQAMCERHLATSLSVDNVLLILDCAMQHSCSKLKSSCVRFARTNMESVRKSESWEEFASVDILDAILEFSIR